MLLSRRLLRAASGGSPLPETLDPANPNLLEHWTMDSRSGALILGEKGNIDLTGTDVSFGAGVSGDAAISNSTTTRADGSTTESFVNGITFGCWAYLRSSDIATFISKRGADNDFQFFRGTTSQLQLILWGTSNITSLISPFTPILNQWVFYGFTYDGSSKVVIRGNSTNYTFATSGNINNGSNTLRLFNDFFSAYGDTDLDQVRLFNVGYGAQGLIDLENEFA